MRLAIYSDLPYRRSEEGTLTAEQPVVAFYAALAAHVERLVLVGRLDPEPGEHPHAVPPGIDLAPLPFYASLGPRSLASLRPVLARFSRVLDDVDTVWLLGPHPLAVPFALLARARGRRVVLGGRQHMPDYMRHRHPGSRAALAAGWTLEGAWRALALRMPTVAVGPALADNYRHGRTLDASISLVGADDVLERDDRDFGGELTALSVGRLDPEKNPLLLADVLARLGPRWRLVICGEGSLREALRDRLDELGVLDRADLRGHVGSTAELRGLYRSSHAFLHVSWTEGMPQVLLESWAARLPVVATEVGGVGPMAGDAALLVGPGDAEAPARELERVAADAALRERLTAAGTERVRTRTREAEAARVAAFLEDGRGA